MRRRKGADDEKLKGSHYLSCAAARFNIHISSLPMGAGKCMQIVSSRLRLPAGMMMIVLERAAALLLLLRHQFVCRSSVEAWGSENGRKEAPLRRGESLPGWAKAIGAELAPRTSPSGNCQAGDGESVYT